LSQLPFTLPPTLGTHTESSDRREKKRRRRRRRERSETEEMEVCQHVSLPPPLPPWHQMILAAPLFVQIH